MAMRLAAVLLLWAVPATAAVTGRVVDDAGKPLAGARVRIRALETTDQAYLRMLSKTPEPAVLASAETNDSGAFRLDARSNAVVELTIDASGRQVLSEDVVDGEDAGTFVLKAAAARRGRVTAGGRGVANAVIAIGRSIVTRSDAEGYYGTMDPGPGVDRLVVIHPDYAIVDRPIRRTRDDLALDVALETGTAIGGRVVDDAGKGVAGATVYASAWPLARTRDDGSFDIAHAPVEKPALSAREGSRVGSLLVDRAKAPYVIRLRPGARIAGTVRSSKDETPVAGARLTVRADFGESQWASAISDAKGNFLIDGVEPGSKRIYASHPAFFGGNAPSDQQLEEGARVNRVAYLTPYARLAGKVIDDEQHPIAAARVRIVGTGGTTTTAPDGTFSLRFPSVERAQSLWVLKDALPVVTFGPYALEPGEMKGGLVLRIPKGIRFEMRLIDGAGALVGGESVMLLRRVDPEVRASRTPVPCGGEVRPCRTDGEGRLAMTIVEGKYDISAGGETTVRRDLNDQTLDARGSPMTIELERGAAIEGQVVWADGSPANIRAMVIVNSIPPTNVPVIDGAFTVRNVPPGKVTLTVDAGPPTFARSEPVEVTAPASGVKLRLQRGGRVEGRVVDGETNQPMRDFIVTVQQTGMRGRSIPSKAFQPEDGKFAVEDLAPGTYNLAVHATGYTRSSMTPITIEEGKTATAQIALERGGTVSGRVTAEGRVLADAQVAVAFSRETRSGFAPRRTDANGEYTIDGLPAGTHRLEVQRQGFVVKSVPVTVVTGKETRADVDLERGRELRGRVIDVAGRAMAMAEVSARTAGGMMPSAILTTDADGSFRLSGLDDATYTISAQKEGYVETRVEANPATTGNVTLTLTRGGTITGRILGVPAAELQYVQVRAYGVRNSTTPDPSGAFTLTGVPDGDLTVAASMYRPRRRDVTGPRVRVVNGVAPPVELDFNAGIAVRGRVTQRGQTVEGYIMFMPAQPSREVQPGSAEITRDGTYEARLAAPGEYQVMVSRHGFSGNLNAGRVNVSGDMTHDVDLRGAPVSGVVVDAVSRAPIAGASVMLLPGSEVRTNAAGRFTFDLVTDGEYKVRAQADEYAPDMRALTVQNGFAPEVELLLSRGATAMFRVIDASTGELVEISGVAVTDAAKAGVYYGAPPADANGIRRLTLQPGTYEMRVFGREYPPAVVTLTVPAPPLDVKLARGPR